MHEDYSDDQYDYDDAKKQYKHYFKFDPAAWDAWGKWLQDALNEIVDNNQMVWYTYSGNPDGFPYKMLPVNSWNPGTGKDSYQYLGSNYQGQPIWKKKYFICDPINQKYRKHIESNAVHFVHQPHYYKGMFDILN